MRADPNRWISRRPADRDSAAVFSRQVQALRELYERSRLDRDARVAPKSVARSK
ncbi:MAG: hypothetical protein ACRDY4_15735 [Acidimicrobiia bacterium]